MKIGIYINQRSDAGGGFYEALNSISKIDEELGTIVYFTSNRDCFNNLIESGIDAKYFHLSHFRRLLLFFRSQILLLTSRIIPGNVIPTKLLSKLLSKNNFFEKQFAQEKIDLVFFTSPDSNAIYMEKLNFCLSVWDMAHIEIPFYPELRDHYSFETRDYYYRRVLPRAYAILVGHNECKKSIVYRYNVNMKKVYTIPFKASPKLRFYEDQKFVPENSITEDKYVFYPSQYSPHKNHRFVIDAFNDYYNKYPDARLKLIFVGSDKGLRTRLQNMVNRYGLDHAVRFLGFQSDEKLYSLYKHCEAVIVPSHIGPGTLPSLEALYLGKAIILPNYDFNKNFYGEQAHYYNFDNPIDLSKILYELENSSETIKHEFSNRQQYYKIQSFSEEREFNLRVKQFKIIRNTVLEDE